MHPPGDPLFRTLLTRSTTMGEKWQKPYFAPDFDWYGVDPPGLSQLRDSTVVFTQFRFGWYPLGLARKRRAAGELISISPLGEGGQKISLMRSGETHSTLGTRLPRTVRPLKCQWGPYL